MNYIENLISRIPALSACKSEIEAAADIMTETYLRGGKILLCGNGGSAAGSTTLNHCAKWSD